MNGDGTSEQITDDRPSDRSKSVADVQFNSAFDNGLPPRTRNTKPRAADKERQKDRHTSPGERLKNRLSLKSKPSILRSRQSSTQDGERTPSISTRSVHSTAEEKESKQGALREDEGSARATSDAAEWHVKKTGSPSTNGTPSRQSDVLAVTSSAQGAASTSELSPAQLVQMALSLSESRKRHSAYPHGSQSPAEANLLRQSIVGPQLRTQHGSLLQRFSLGEESYQASPSPRTSSQAEKHPQVSSVATSDTLVNPLEQSFSPATLVRAQRASRYFELADQHRRLLQILESQSPPMGTLPPGVPRTAVRYNPLQALRNRKARESKKSPVLVAEEDFQDVTSVGEWIDDVDAATKSDHTGGAGHSRNLPMLQSVNCATISHVSGHKRTGTADTVIQKQISSWSITPAELLADTYTVLHGDRLKLSESHNILNEPDTTAHSGQNGSLHHQPTTTNSGGLADQSDNNRRRFLPLKAADRLRGARHKFTRSASASSASSIEAANRSLFDPKLDSVNVGPLRRYMNHLMETQEHEAPTAAIPASPDHWGMAQAQRLATRQRATSRASTSQQIGLDRQDRPASSQQTKPVVDNTLRERLSSETSLHASPTAKHDNNTYDFSNFRIDQAGSAQTSRARSGQPAISPVEEYVHGQRSSMSSGIHEAKVEPSRLSVEAARPTLFRRHKTADSTSSVFTATRSSSGKDGELMEQPASAVNRPRRGGRFVDMMRNESFRFGDRIRNRDRRQKGGLSSLSAHNTDMSEDDMDNELSRNGKITTSVDGGSARTSFERIVGKSRSHIPALPSFKPTAPREQTTLSPNIANGSGDHISRQQAALRLQNRSPRFQRLAPPPIDASGDRKQPPSYEQPPTELRGGKHPSTSDQQSLTNIGALSSTDDYKTSSKPTSWPKLPEDRGEGLPEKTSSVQSRDIARARAILIASGIKARTLAQQLESPPASSAFVLSIARSCDLDVMDLTSKSRIEQTPHAARLLLAHLDAAVYRLQNDSHTFQAQHLQALVAKQEVLKSRVREELAELVHGASDQVDAFSSELSTQATMRTKQVDDAVDAVLRLRRRQFRMLRLALFKLLEWFVLALLWFVWFVVMCFKTVKRTIVGIFQILRWLLTF